MIPQQLIDAIKLLATDSNELTPNQLGQMVAIGIALIKHNEAVVAALDAANTIPERPDPIIIRANEPLDLDKEHAYIAKLTNGGHWSTTTWAGGFSFAGKRRAIANGISTPHYGEPLTVPDSEEDHVWIAHAPELVVRLISELRNARQKLEQRGVGRYLLLIKTNRDCGAVVMTSDSLDELAKQDARRDGTMYIRDTLTDTIIPTY